MRTLRARPALLASLVIGLVAMMGLGFALWSETLSIDATVDTGNLNMRFAAVSLSEVSDNPAPGDADCVGDGLTQQGNKATVTFTDAYPGYSCILTTIVRNIGTVDAVLVSTPVTGDTAPFDIERLLLSEEPEGGADDGQGYPNVPGPQDGPVWLVTFKTSNGNTTEDQAYELHFEANFENGAP